MPELVSGGVTITGPQSMTVSSYDGKESPSLAKSFREYRVIREHPTIKLSKDFRVTMAREAEWEVWVGEEDRDSVTEEALRLLEKYLAPLRDQILDVGIRGDFDYGWQGFEIVWGLTDAGMMVPMEAKPLLQELTSAIWVDVGTGRFLGYEMQQADGTTLDFVGRERVLHLAFRVEGQQWFGESMLEGARKPWSWWDNCNKGAEAYDSKLAGSFLVIGYPVGETPYNGVMTDNHTIAKDVNAAVKSGGSAIVPKRQPKELLEIDDESLKHGEWDFELMGSTGQAQEGFVARLMYLDKLLARAGGISDRVFLEGQYGTKAESGVHADLTKENCKLLSVETANAVTAQTVRPFMTMNWGPEYERSVIVRVREEETGDGVDGADAENESGDLGPRARSEGARDTRDGRDRAANDTPGAASGSGN